MALKGWKVLLKGAIDRIEELYNTGGDITGLTTGFIDLDRMTSGLQPSDLVIVAGRPSMGKTSFAMNLVENAALASDRPLMVFSMEMAGRAAGNSYAFLAGSYRSVARAHR